MRSFAVDFVGQTENFVADELRATPDTPYVHDVAELVRHRAPGHRARLRPARRPRDRGRKVIRARDIPAGLGDMDASLYLLFKAIREHSTVALSGESADEVFGGYQQFFDPRRQQADTFPWLVRFATRLGDAGGTPAPGPCDRALDLRPLHPGRLRHAPSPTIERLDGESDFEYRMRMICHLHLTRFVRMLLDRKDRTSMAVGLEVRVPFCDHRLVEYVYNAPWSLKTFDGREKSLLREATARRAAPSVVRAGQEPLPVHPGPASTSSRCRSNAKELLAEPAHPVFDLVSRTWLEDAVRTATPVGGHAARHGLERVLDLALWMDMYAPTVDIP